MKVTESRSSWLLVLLQSVRKSRCINVVFVFYFKFFMCLPVNQSEQRFFVSTVSTLAMIVWGDSGHETFKAQCAAAVRFSPHSLLSHKLSIPFTAYPPILEESDSFQFFF